MAKYELPTLPKLPKVKKNQVLLISSGDLRDSANEVCWANQKQMEDELTEAVPERRLRAGAGPSLQARGAARLHRLAERGHVRLRRHRSGGQADRGRDRLAVFPPCAGGADRPQGADPDRGQLVGHLAGIGRHAQPQRLADQGRREVLDPLERSRSAIRPSSSSSRSGSKRARSNIPRPTSSR